MNGLDAIQRFPSHYMRLNLLLKEEGVSSKLQLNREYLP